mgnify:CR=1 FL=1
MFTLALTTGIQVLVSMAALAMPVLATLIGPHLNQSAASVASWLAALVYAGAMVGAITSGPLIQRWGAIRLSQLGLLLCAGGLLLACVGVLPVVLLSAFVIGLGYGPITPASSQMLSRTTDARNYALVPDPLVTLLDDFSVDGADWGVMKWQNAALSQQLAALGQGGLTSPQAATARLKVATVLQQQLPVLPVAWAQCWCNWPGN